MSERIDDLDAIEARAWQSLVGAIPSYRAPFHTGTVATVGLDGAPQARTVVLRSADASTRMLAFHTDRRAPKFAELSAEPRLSWLLYDEPSRMQLRLQAIATLHTDDALADAHWRDTTLNSRRAYAATAAPGTGLAATGDGLIDEAGDARWTLSSSEICRQNFAVITSHIWRLEVLVLSHRGHRRAAFDYDPNGLGCTGRWLIP